MPLDIVLVCLLYRSWIFVFYLLYFPILLMGYRGFLTLWLYFKIKKEIILLRELSQDNGHPLERSTAKRYVRKERKEKKKISYILIYPFHRGKGI